MKYSFKKTISMVLKILCVIAIIATAGRGEASAAKKTNKRKAKTTKVKKTRKHHQVVKEDERVVAAKNVEKEVPYNIIKEEVPEFPVLKVEPKIIEESMYNIAPEREEPKKEEPRPEKEPVYSSAVHMPSYPGGDGALMNYIANQIKYPKVAQENGVQGKVVVQFVVTKTGKIGDVKVMRGVDKALDREAVRVCKSLPAFSPGRNAEGDPVNVWYTIPIAFKLKGAK